MKNHLVRIWLLGFVLAVAAPAGAAAMKLQPQTEKGWKKYAELTQERINKELTTAETFSRVRDIQSLKGGRLDGLGPVYIQRLGEGSKEINIEDGTIHHWLGVIFIPGVSLEKLLAWVQNYNQHVRFFQEVELSDLRSRNADTYEVFLRLARSKFGVTARFNTNHSVTYRRNGPGRASSASIATSIKQLKGDSEDEYAEGDESGYLWHLNSYWRFIEREGGVQVECESVGLSRSLGTFWGIVSKITLGTIQEKAEAVAKESLQNTLTALRDGVRGVSPADAALGTWKVNAVKSKFSPGPGPKSETARYELAGDNIRIIVDGTDSEGKSIHHEWTGRLDGKDSPVRGDPNTDTRAFKKIDTYNLEIVAKKGGKVTTKAKATYAETGKLLTLSIKGTSGGKKVNTTVVYDKQ